VHVRKENIGLYIAKKSTDRDKSSTAYRAGCSINLMPKQLRMHYFRAEYAKNEVNLDAFDSAAINMHT
jgi:hypothetical protein